MTQETNSAAEQRIALVTGASRGIGAACARELAARGCTVIVNHSGTHSAQAAAALVAELNAINPADHVALQADVSDFSAAEELVAFAKARFGRLDVLVNNAGITRDGLLMRMKEADFDDVIRVNLKGAFNCTRHATSLMVRQRYGRIVNISSVVGIAGNAGQLRRLQGGHHRHDQVHSQRTCAQEHHRQRRSTRLHRNRHDGCPER